MNPCIHNDETVILKEGKGFDGENYQVILRRCSKCGEMEIEYWTIDPEGEFSEKKVIFDDDVKRILKRLF
jgi:hypothetical protein